MTTLLVGKQGEISLPKVIRERHQIVPDKPVRIVETREGILLFPLTDEPISPELASELEDWQAVSTHAVNSFPYEVD